MDQNHTTVVQFGNRSCSLIINQSNIFPYLLISCGLHTFTCIYAYVCGCLHICAHMFRGWRSMLVSSSIALYLLLRACLSLQRPACPCPTRLSRLGIPILVCTRLRVQAATPGFSIRSGRRIQSQVPRLLLPTCSPQSHFLISELLLFPQSIGNDSVISHSPLAKVTRLQWVLPQSLE